MTNIIKFDRHRRIADHKWKNKAKQTFETTSQIAIYFIIISFIALLLGAVVVIALK